MSVLTIVAVIAILGYVISRQLLGEPIRGKRLIILPAILTLIGILDLAKHTVHPGGTDILLIVIVIGAAVALGIGLAQGRMMRLEERDGGLWGQLPLQGVWLWAILYASRGALIGVAHATDAHVAAGSQSELLILGINRLGQAASIATRALAAGMALAPENDGSQPLASLFSGRQSPGRSRSHPTPRVSADQATHPALNTPAALESAEKLARLTQARWGDIAHQLSDVAADAANARMQDKRSERRDRHATRRDRPR